MPGRTLLLVSAVLLSIALITSADGAAAATDECLAKPDQSAPEGQHWYYRTDRSTKKKCWYLAEERGKAAEPAADTQSTDTASADDDDAATTASTKTASPTPAKPAAAARPKPPAEIASPNPVSLERAASQKPRPAQLSQPPQPAAAESTPPTAPAAQPPIGNARAEWLGAPRPEAAAPLAPAQSQASAGSAQTDASQGAVNSRFPNPNSGSPIERAAALLTTPTTPTKMASADPQPAPAAATDGATPTAASPPPAAQNGKGAPAVTREASGPDYSEYFLFLVFAVALAALGVLGWTAIRYFTERQLALRDHPAFRRLASQPVDAPRPPEGSALLAMPEVPMDLLGELAATTHGEPSRTRQQQRIAKQAPPPRRYEDEIDEIEQLLALARQPGTLTPGSWPLAPEHPRAAE